MHIWISSGMRSIWPLRGRFDHVATWGDSLTYGTGATLSYPTDFSALAGKPIYNGGVVGNTSTQIATRMLADVSRYSWPTIIWAGRNNYTDPTTVKADIAAMVAALGHTHYLVLSVINGEYANEYSGQADYNTIVALNVDLSALYGSHYVDVRSYLVSLYDPLDAQDVIDHGHDIPPASLRSGTIHLNDAGYAAVANKVYESIGVLFP